MKATVTTSILLMALTASLALPAEDSSYQHYLRAGYYIQSGRLEQAVAELQKSIEADPDAAAPHVTLGRVLLGLNRPDEALEALEKAERLDPSDAEVPKMVGRVYLQLAATDASADYASKAEKAFKRALELDPEEQESLFYLALLYERTGRSEEALEVKQRLLSVNPTLHDVWVSVATGLREQGDLEGELEALIKADELEPGNAEVLRRAGEIYERLGRQREANVYYEQSIARIDEILQQQPGQPILLMLRAEVFLWHTSQYDLAVADCDELIGGTVEGVDDGHRLLATVYKATALYFMADYEPAAELFGQTEGIVLGQMIRSFQEMVLSYANAAGDQHALELIADLEGRTTNPDQLDYLKWLRSRVLEDADREPEALELLENMLAENPEDGQAYLRLVQLLINLKEYGRAAETLDRGLEVAGQQRGFSFLKGVLQERSGDFEAARATFAQIIEDNPDDDLALNYLGYMLADRGIELERAIGLIERALELQPHNGSYLDSLGWAHFQKGDLDLAERYVRESMRTQYRSAEVREHMGHIHLARGRRQEALREFRTALEYGLDEVKSTEEVERLVAELEGKR